MAGTQSYNYSKTELHIKPFEYAVPSTSFIEEDAVRAQINKRLKETLRSRVSSVTI